MKVQVVYASKTKQRLLMLEVPEDCTLEKAIEFSGILTAFPEINLVKQPVGIFSKKAELSTLLQPGDRIEIYRPLTIDPMQKRRLLAKNQFKNYTKR